MKQQQVMRPSFMLALLGLLMLALFPKARGIVDRLERGPPELQLHPGCLLVARPGAVGDSFAHTLILLLQYDHERVFGVVVNRPSGDGRGSYLGGPVQPREALISVGAGLPTGLVEADPLRPLHTLPGGIFWTQGGRSSWPDEVTQLRVFHGYAGWAQGQLEAELDEGAFTVVEPSLALLYHRDGEAAWLEALGKTLR